MSVKIADQNKRKDAARTNNSCVVLQNWKVEVKVTYLKTLTNAKTTYE
jgi:hypothetical protein